MRIRLEKGKGLNGHLKDKKLFAIEENYAINPRSKHEDDRLGTSQSYNLSMTSRNKTLSKDSYRMPNNSFNSALRPQEQSLQAQKEPKKQKLQSYLENCYNPLAGRQAKPQTEKSSLSPGPTSQLANNQKPTQRSIDLSKDVSGFDASNDHETR